MQLLKTMMMLTALIALSVVMTGCPTDEEGSLTCATDADCIEGEICHPAAKTCVQTCTSASDCPSSARAECTAVSATDNRTVCKCATDPLCNSEGATDLVCSTLDKVCTPKCTSDAACGAGRTCDTATGQCKAGGGATCTYGSCAAGEVCGATTNKCEAGATCTGEAQSTCSYGQFCGTGKCQDVAKPTCGNLTGKTAVVNFTPAAGTGSIIYKVEKVEFTPTTTAECPSTTNPVKVIPRISFYVKSGTVPADDSGFSGFFYVKTDQGEVPLNAANLFNYTKAADNKSGSVSVFLCAANNITSIDLAFYFTGGNGYCTTFTR
jgi:hypothetical protein